ncbi:DNA ligase [Janthinobacterium phage vB_JliS-Donnerlittchen]|uniref:DNA ligase n=1 Tax=Janthinobacterium phage vB_JliS-Donnerlittchen TaxID=2948610 RepID=A0A9E7MQY5_9CAUD|nr:DNA ligase [Janthinobacterium phage vB_JliM-Donnerlittchen]USN14464.1 DNA ligase [Janthinobacterium phage vB_JliM-Donnerlittchen]
MSKQFRPMLSATVEAVDRLHFPLLASVKLDGIRALVLGGVVVSRNLKPIPNRHVQALFGRSMFEGLDGELMVGDPGEEDVFRRTSSGVMSTDGEPDVRFHVFDCMSDPGLPFHRRLGLARDLAEGFDRVEPVAHRVVASPAELDEFEAAALSAGYEGVMLRSADSPYKFGRGTLSKQDLMKLKRFEDAEARVVGFQELMHNSNEATTGLLGQTERGHSKEGMVGMGTLGALQVLGEGGKYGGVAFNIGSGFDAATRASIWADRDAWIGRLVKFKFFPLGSKDAPRFPIFLGERHPDDAGVAK